MLHSIIPYIIQAVVTIGLFVVIMRNLHINGPVSGLEIIPIISCLLVSVASVIVYGLYVFFSPNVSWHWVTAICAFIMPFVEMIAFVVLGMTFSKVHYSISSYNKFYYEVSVSAPELSPVHVKRIGLENGKNKYESNNDHFEVILNQGLSDSYLLPDQLYFHEERPLPQKMTATWVSLIDRKVYTIDTELPYDTLRSYFKMEDESWEDLTFCFLPEGEVKVGLGRRNFAMEKLLDWSAKGVECSDEEVLADLCQALQCKSMEEYFDRVYSKELKKNSRWLTSLQEKGSPVPLFDKCMQRFNYDIFFEFKGEEYTITEYDVRFANGERCYRYGEEPYSNKLTEDIGCPSRIASINGLKWETSQYEYELHIYFNEEESFLWFDENYGNDRMQKGELKLSLRIDSSNNTAYLSEYLYVGGREDAIKELDNLYDFRLIRTKIDNSDDKMYYGESKRSHFGM